MFAVIAARPSKNFHSAKFTWESTLWLKVSPVNTPDARDGSLPKETWIGTSALCILKTSNTNASSATNSSSMKVPWSYIWTNMTRSFLTNAQREAASKASQTWLQGTTTLKRHTCSFSKSTKRAKSRRRESMSAITRTVARDLNRSSSLKPTTIGIQSIVRQWRESWR